MFLYTFLSFVVRSVSFSSFILYKVTIFPNVTISVSVGSMTLSGLYPLSRLHPFIALSYCHVDFDHCPWYVLLPIQILEKHKFSPHHNCILTKLSNFCNECLCDWYWYWYCSLDLIIKDPSLSSNENELHSNSLYVAFGNINGIGRIGFFCLICSS